MMIGRTYIILKKDYSGEGETIMCSIFTKETFLSEELLLDWYAKEYGVEREGLSVWTGRPIQTIEYVSEMTKKIKMVDKEKRKK